MPLRPFLTALIFAVLVCVCVQPARGARIGTPDMEIREVTRAGNEIRVLFETSRTYQPLLSHSHKTDRVRGWLAIIDTQAAAPAPRTRLIGPLWSVDTPQSMLSFQSGVRFTAGDVAAGKAKPPCGFDDKGRLIRRLSDPAGALILESLDTSAAVPTWVAAGNAAVVGQVGKDWIDGVLSSRGGRVYIQEEADGKTRMYDLMSGEPRNDDWLTGAFADWRQRPDMGNARTWVTNDLMYFVVVVQDGYYTGGKPWMFRLGDQEYSSAEYAIVYTRPDLVPVVFRRPPAPANTRFFKPPHGAVSLDGELLLLEVRENSLFLRRSDGTTRYEWTGHAEPTWPAANPRTIEVDPETGGITIWGMLDEKEAEPWNTVLLWDAKHDRLQKTELNLGSLFQRSGGEFKPLDPIAVAAPR